MNPPPATGGENPTYGSDSFALPDFAEAVLGIVDQIPEGMVLAYGDIAELLGQGGPRQVGAVMSQHGSSVTWWRVIRASGEAPQGLEDEALAHWRSEGTSLVRGAIDGRRVDMNVARWDGRAAARMATEAAMTRVSSSTDDDLDAWRQDEDDSDPGRWPDP